MPKKLSTGLVLTDDQLLFVNNQSFDKGRLDVSLAADAIVSILAASDQPIIWRELAAQKGEWRYWNGSYWAPYFGVRNDVRAILENLTQRQVDSIVATMQLAVMRAWGDFDQLPVCTYRNTSLIFDEASGEIKQRKPTPSDLCTYHIPHAIKKGPTTNWDKLLARSFPDKDDQLTLQEQFGVTLFPPLWPQAVHIWEGPANTGKTTMENILRELVVRCSDAPICTFSEPHGTSALVGSFLNIDAESEYLSPKDEIVLKQVSGGSAININPKNLNPYSAKLPLTMLMVTNNLARFSDRTEGLWSRLVVLPFRQPVIGKRKDIKQIIAAIRPEYDAILAWAIKGLLRVVKRGTRSAAFTQSSEAKAMLAEHKKHSQPLREWFGLTFKADPAAAIVKTPDPTYHVMFTLWCRQNGYKTAMNKYNFDCGFKKLVTETVGPGGHGRMHNGGPRTWKGLAIRTQEEVEELAGP